jgi:HEXXH motif-containing protein
MQLAGEADIIEEAAALIRVVPELDAIIRQCVQEILVLRAPDDSFDVSHSEPQWATRIFVSIPRPSVVAALRVAEAIVHEAMHLNLTFLEERIQLIAKTRLLYSPWKVKDRPASGVLHGLYVFVCIYRFFAQISRLVGIEDESRRHIERRRAEIRAGIASIERSSLLQCLTAGGLSVAKTSFAFVDC